MSAYYLSIKSLHVLCVILSGGLFFARGALVVANKSVGNHVAVRRLSYLIDTVLLISALALIAIVHQYPFVDHWLTVKLGLLIVYIVLGVFALRRAPTRLGKSLCWIAALGIYLLIISVARTHQPLGWFATLLS
jgi:uncharacterized membrane protein SirB2